MRIVITQALVSTHKGDAIATFHQMALLGKGKSILLCIQMEAFGADINDRSHSLPGGFQCILMDGYQLSLEFNNGLPYLHCQKPTGDDLSLLPHIIMTLDVTWIQVFMITSMTILTHFMTPWKTYLSTNITLINMGSIITVRLQRIILSQKKNSLTPLSMLILMIMLLI
jgi:hypothetical protein